MIRDKVSEILEYRIPKDGWDNVIKGLDENGKITPREHLAIIKVLCKTVELLELKIENLERSYVEKRTDNPVSEPGPDVQPTSPGIQVQVEG